MRAGRPPLPAVRRQRIVTSTSPGRRPPRERTAMKVFRSALAAVVVLGAGLLAAQNFQQPAAKAPDDATLKAIAERTDKLGQQILELRKQGVTDPVLADIEVFHKAAVWLVRRGEFFPADVGTWALAVLDR